MPLRVLFEMPTVAELAELVEVFYLGTQSSDMAPEDTGKPREKGRL